MVTLLVRLKLRLLVNQFRRSPWQVAGLVIALLYASSIVLLVCGSLVGLRLAPVPVAEQAVVLGGSLTVLGSALVPLLLGVDDTLDPHRFALFGLDRSRLATALAVAALVGVPGVALVLVCLASLATWSRGPWPLLVAVVAAATTVALCILLSRISAAAAALLLATRRSRDTISAIVVIALVLTGPVVVLASSGAPGSRLLEAVAPVTSALGWTPLGASWAAPAAAAAGDAGAVPRLLIALASAGAAWLGWRALVARTLVTPVRHARPQTVSGLGWFAVLPSTPLGAIAARTTTYWARDVRYRVSALVVPLTPVVLMLVLALVGVQTRLLALIPVPVVALFAGWLSHNDIAYDSTAIWLHVAGAVRGTADRLGRIAPVAAVTAPVLVLASAVCGAVAGDVRIGLALAGVAAALLLSGAGLGAITSVLLPYPVPRPGASPFQQPNAAGGVAAVVQSVLFLLQLVCAAPAIAAGAIGLLGDAHAGAWYAASLAAGLVIGLVVLVVGTRIGGRAFERRGPELLGAALRA